MRILFGIDITGHVGLQIRDRHNLVAQVRGDQVRNLLLPHLQRRKEELGVRQLVLVRRIVQQFQRLRTGCLLFFWSPRKTKMSERVLIVDQQLVEERVGRIHAVTQHDVPQLMRDHGGQARFIRQHVDQSAAQHDRMPQRERFQRGGHQHAAFHFRIDVQIVGDFEIVHHRVEHFVDLAPRRHQPDALQPVRNVILRLTVPRTLRLHRTEIVGGFRVILYRRLHQDLAQLLFLRGVPDVISPQTRLRFEVQLLGQRVVQVFFFAVYERREPQPRLCISPPAIEMEVPTCVSAAAIGAVEPHDMKVLILYPDTSKKAALTRFRIRTHIEHQAAHFAQEFAANVVKFVVLFVEPVGVDENHLQKAVRQVLHRERKEISDAGEKLFPLGISVGQRNQVDALGKIRAAQEILVACGCESKFLIRFQVLDVGLDQR